MENMERAILSIYDGVKQYATVQAGCWVVRMFTMGDTINMYGGAIRIRNLR
jgi:hypothetical protein